MIFRNDEKSSLVLALVKQLGQNFFLCSIKKNEASKTVKEKFDSYNILEHLPKGSFAFETLKVEIINANQIDAQNFSY